MEQLPKREVFSSKWSYMGIRRCRSLASSEDVIPRQRRFTSVLTERPPSGGFFICMLQMRGVYAHHCKTKSSRFLNDLMKCLVETNKVEYTIPDKPSSRLQKYLLTDAGKAALDVQQ